MEEIKEKLYIYFIYSLEKNKNKEIISNFPLKIIKTLEKDDEKNKDFDINLYEIEIDKNKLNKNDIVKIQLKENDSKPMDFLIDDIYNINRNIFLYKIVFNLRNDMTFNFIIRTLIGLPPTFQNNLTIEEKYEIFKTIHKNSENITKDLIYYTLEILEKNKGQNFSFFVTIFNDIELDEKNDLFRLMELFDINKVIFENQKEQKVNVKKVLDFIDILSKIKDEQILEEHINNCLLFLLLLIYKFHLNIKNDIFNNKNINKYLLKILLNDKKNVYNQIFFSDLKLSSKNIKEFINYIDNYKDILLIFSYNNNFLEILEIINDIFEVIIDLIKKDQTEEKKFQIIKLGDFIITNKNDDLIKIKNQLEKLFSKEKKADINIVDISCELLEEYIIYHENNINELITLYKIIKIISINKVSFKYFDIALLVHNRLEKFAMEKKLINIKLLLFMETIPSSRRKMDKKILNNIVIDKIDDEFIKKFKIINWSELLTIQQKELVNEICKLIKNIKYFTYLFLFFDFNEETDKFIIDTIKERFINLLEISTEKERENVIEDCSKLIYLLNIKNCDLKTFINKSFYKFYPSNIVHLVYSDIYTNNEYKINEILLDLIQEFYNKKENSKFINSTYLIFVIDKNKIFDSTNLLSYYIKYEDFFNLNQTDKFLFLEKIKVKKLKYRKCLYDYIINCKNEINKIIEKINDSNIEYKLINQFFIKNKENELNKRIEIITTFLYENDEYKNLFGEIKTKIKDINKIINDLKIVKEKMNTYFKAERKEDIQEIDNIINSIELNNLNYYLYNKEQIDKYLNIEDINELPLINENTNIFFKIEYENTKRNNENGLGVVDRIKKNLKNLLITLTSKSNYEYINKLNQIMNQFNENQYNNLSGEIEGLIKFVGEKLDVNKNNIKNTLKYIWKKDVIYNCTILFKIIITHKDILKTDFFQINEVIRQYLEKPKNISVIELSITLYKNYQIEFIDDNNFEIFKTIKLIQNMNETASFLINIETKKLEKRVNQLNKEDNMKNTLKKLINFKMFIDDILSHKSKDVDIVKDFINEIFNTNKYKKDFITIINYYKLLSDDLKRNINI